MIPSSYLFKGIYCQHWEEPDAPVVVARQSRFLDGLVRPLASAIGALRSRPARTGHYRGGHVYE